MKNKQISKIIFEKIRKPIAPVSIIFKDKKDKRVKNFDYKKELEKY